MGIDTMVGVGPVVHFDGKELTVSGQTFRHLGEVAAQMIDERPKVFDAIRELVPIWREDTQLAQGIVQQCFLEAKTWNSPGLDEIMEYFLYSWNGQIMGFWLSIRDNDRGLWTLNHFREVFSDKYEEIVRVNGAEGFVKAKEWTTEWQKKIDQASGGDEVGNSHGSLSTSEEGQESQLTGNTSSPS